METYELTQKILSFGPTYEVRNFGQDDVMVTIKGKILTMSPQLSMVEGTEGPAAGGMKGNFLRTKFECFDKDGQLLGTLAFPTLALKQSCTIQANGREYKADGGFLGGEFRCTDANGNPVLVISKQLSLRDKFSIATSGEIPRELALLAAVAIDQRYFEEN